MTESPKIIDTNITSKVTEYPLLVLQHYSHIEVKPIEAVSVKTDVKPVALNQFFVKAGIGSQIMPLGEFYFDSKRSKKFVYGIHSKHVSSFGKMKNYAPSQFDRTTVAANGILNEKKYTLGAAVNYGSHGFQYYGLKAPLNSISRDSISQRFQDIGTNLSYSSHVSDSAKLNYNFGVAYTNFTSKKPLIAINDNWRVRENNVNVNANGFYKRDKETFMLDLNVRNNMYQYGMPGDTNNQKIDTGIVQHNTIFNITPGIQTQLFNKRLKVKAGVDVAIESLSKTQAFVYPIGEVSYAMYESIFVPYLGVKGGLKQTTFRSLATQNQFVRTNQLMKNENNPYDVYAGFKGTLSKRISFNLSGNYSRILNKALFVTDSLYSFGNQFQVIYDTLNIAMVEGSIAYQIDEKLKIDGIARYYNYSLKNNAYAWNLPQWQLIARGKYSFKEDLTFNLDVNLEGGRKSLAYAKGDNIIEKNNQLVQKMGLLADLNFEMEYRYTKNISAFIQLNNALAQRYIRWYNYPVQGFQIMGGITARF
jgi:hypothetical protein